MAEQQPRISVINSVNIRIFLGMYLQTDPALQREVGQLIMLQRYLDSLQEKKSDKDFAVLKCRSVLS